MKIKLTTLHQERYGKWAGNPNGQIAKPECCAKSVYGGRWVGRQCGRKRGYGPEEAYCKQHAEKEAKRHT